MGGSPAMSRKASVRVRSSVKWTARSGVTPGTIGWSVNVGAAQVSRFSLDWAHVADVPAAKPIRCRSVGWLISHDDECAVLTSHRGDEQSADNA